MSVVTEEMIKAYSDAFFAGDNVERVERVRAGLEAVERAAPAPIPMRIPCPECGELHIDEGEFATKPHHTHSCQNCGLTWRPAVVPTVGVRFLPGFKNDQSGGDHG